MSFKNLKRNNKKFDTLVEAGAAMAGGGTKSYKDDRFWEPTVDKAGNGYAVIRFLPAPDGEELPWQLFWDHGFKGPTGLWYFERSLTSLGQDDPVGELNGELWNDSEDDNSPGKKQARKQKRKLHYVSNIEVISDPANPENDGKRFMFKYGKKIFDKIMSSMQPEFEDEEAVNPFDFWEGANFKIKIRKVEGWRNYDKSEFDKPSVLSEDDDVLEKIYNELYSLEEYAKGPEHYKTYDQLKAKLNKVLALNGQTARLADEQEEAPAPEQKEIEPQTAESTSYDDDDEEDDSMAEFRRLAAED